MLLQRRELSRFVGWQRIAHLALRHAQQMFPDQRMSCPFIGGDREEMMRSQRASGKADDCAIEASAMPAQMQCQTLRPGQCMGQVFSEAELLPCPVGQVHK